MASYKGYKRVITLGLDYSEFKGGVSEVNRQIKVLDSEFKNASERAKLYGSNTDQLGLKQEQLTQKTILQTQKIGELKKNYEENSKALGENSKKTQDAYIKYKDAETQLLRLEDELKNVNKELSDNKGKFGEAADSVQEFIDKANESELKLQDLGKGMTDLGVAMSVGITLPLMAVGKTSMDAYTDFESAFAGVRKTVNATEEQFKELEIGIRDMAKVMPTAAKDIAAVAETAGQLGIQREAILGFSKVMIDLGNTTNLSANDAATALAQFANITQMSQEDFDRLGSTIFKLDTSLATSAKSIVDMGLRLAGAGKQIGMSESEILSLAGAISSVGIEADAGGSAFSKVMINMQLAVEKGGKDLQNFAKVAGMSSSEFKRTFKEDATGALVAFIQGLGGMEAKGKSTIRVLDDMGITEVRMRDALLRAATAGDLFSKSIETGTQAWKDNTALTEGAAKKYETFNARMELLKNNLKELGITIGSSIAPVLVDIINIFMPLIELVGDVLELLNKLPEPIRKIIVVVGLFMALLGPVIALMGKIFTKIDSVPGKIKGIGDAVGGLSSAFSALNSPLMKVVVTFTLLIGALAAILVLIAAIKGKSSQVSEIIDSLGGITVPLNDMQVKANSLPKYAVGTNYIDKDQVAVVHKGEAIIPEQSNPWNPNATNPYTNNGGGGDTFILQVDMDRISDVNKLINIVNELQQTRRAGVAFG